ncbi:MAG: Fur family transcriptional regulator [Aminipila sp.]
MYNTKQQDILLNFLKDNRENSYTVDELFNVEKVSLNMGKSTIYRLVEKLVKANSIKKIKSNNKRRVSYQFIDMECHNHLHLICGKCGEVIHANEKILQDITKQLKDSNFFVMDNIKTDIYGTCQKCTIEGGTKE